MTDDISQAEELERHWPRDGDRLFVTTSWAYNAHVVRDPNERAYRLPMGYKRAADLLVERAATDVVDRANVIYPALYCYRQALELLLKGLIDEFGARRSENTHSLRSLWEQFAAIVKQRGPEEPLGFNAAGVLIAEMDSADQRSDGFRFPADTKRLPFAFGDQGIDLDNLREVMAGLENFFECASLHFSHQDELASDLASNSCN
jgi:hypothetical protein